MSLSRPQLTNPAARFYTWKGSEGKLVWWDKENSKEVEVPLPFKFIPIDQLHTIAGYSDADESGFWSNEVKDLRHDLTVKTKRGIKFVGPYRNPQNGDVQIGSGATKGARYAKSIYIAHKIGDDWALGNIKAVGVSNGAWIDFDRENHAEGKIVAITGSTEGHKGTTDFFVPTFKLGGDPPADVLQIATNLDAELQTYLDTYLTAPKYDNNAEPIQEDAFEDTKATPEQIADFEAKKAKLADKYEDEEIKDMVTTDFDESEPINLDEIPF